MKFKLEQCNHLPGNKETTEKLMTLGFRFKREIVDSVFTRTPQTVMVEDESVKPEIEFNNIEDLVRFTEKWGQVIVDRDTIIIYNYYRE